MSATPRTEPTPAARSQSLTSWLPLAGLLLIGGVAAGYFLPLSGPPVSESAATVPYAGTIDSQTTATDQPTSTSLPFAQSADTPFHEFPLSIADVRDSQQTPALVIDRQGRIYLGWESKTGDLEKTLFFATSSNHGRSYGEPRAITTSGIFKSGSGSPGRGGGHERRMLPRLATCGESVLLAWCDAPLDGTSVRMLLAQSRDGGQSFSEPATINQADFARPTFTSLAANENGYVSAAWLDCRNGPQQVFAAARAADSPDFMPDLLVFAGQNDQGVCPCCPTASFVTDDGTVLVAFRSQVDGYRDTWISRFDPRKEDCFSEPMPVVPPTWQFDGCPHDGPSLAVSGEWLHVAWMDAHSGRQRAYYGRAKLTDLKFDVQELNAAGPGTQGNAKLCIDSSGQLHALWEESLAEEPTAVAAGEKSGSGGHQHGPPKGAGRVIMHSLSPRADGRFEQPLPIAPRPGRFQMRPAIACGTDGLIVVAWTELDEAGKRLVVTQLNDLQKWLSKPTRRVEN